MQQKVQSESMSLWNTLSPADNLNHTHYRLLEACSSFIFLSLLCGQRQSQWTKINPQTLSAITILGAAWI